MAHTQPVCDQARTRLWGKRSYPRSTLLPPKSPEYYFPIKAIQEVLEFPAEKLELEQLYLCRCSKCRRHAGIEGEFDHMDDSFSEETKQELLGPYAATYALLIYIHNPGLIRRFRQKNLQLQGTNFLNKDHLLFLFDSGFLDSVDEAKVVQEEILEHQYKFLVRKLDARDEVTEISDKETLPIDEDPVPLGSGSFAEVHGFTFHDDEYLGDYFVSRQVCSIK
jgi:hypothetical protein